MKTKILILSLTALFFMSCNAQETLLTIETTEGNITVKLYDETPLHRDNFLNLATTGYYDGVIFHRVISNFMIQTGDPDSKNPEPGRMYGSGGPAERIPAEFVAEKYHKKGALAAARDGNPAKASSGSQFYIVQGQVCPSETLAQMAQQRGKAFSAEQIKDYTTIGGSPWLDGDYTVFGEVVEGLEIVDKIAAVQKDGYDRPIEDIFIVRIYKK